MKKIIILLISLFLLTGCEAVYNINIGDVIDDDLVINALNTKTKEITNKAMLDYNVENFNLAVDYNTPGYPEIYKKLDGYNYYNKKKIDNEEAYGIEFSYSFNQEDYEKTYLLIPFNYREIEVENKYIIFSSGDPKGNTLFLQYPDLDKLTVNIASKYVVVTHNADSVKDNTYTWVLTKDNYLKKEINIKIDTREKFRKTLSVEFSESLASYFFVGLGILAGIALIVVLVKVKNSNK